MFDSYADSHKKPDKGISYDKHYDENSWRRFLWHREQLALTNILDEFLKNREINLLDFACGTGRIAGFLENRISQAVGVDVSESMLNEAKKKLTRTELICADITKENVLKGRKFNLITAFRFFLNAEPELRKAVLEALLPLLDENGYFVFNNHRNSTSSLTRFKYNRCRRKRNFMSMYETRDMVREAGLEIIKIYPVGFLPLYKLKLPYILNNAVDSVAMKFACLQNYSESPIMICKHSASA
jgi:ubiquinone/menaquinone biosynthesis C-methylase UbiE